MNPIQSIGDEYKVNIVCTFNKLTLINEIFEIGDKKASRYKLVFKDYRKFKK